MVSVKLCAGYQQRQIMALDINIITELVEITCQNWATRQLNIYGRAFSRENIKNVAIRTSKYLEEMPVCTEEIAIQAIKLAIMVEELNLKGKD